MNNTAEALLSPIPPPPAWTDGNRFKLLENGEAYFPAVYAAIAAAKREVLIETFILFDDEVGKQLRETLIAAGRRGVRIDLTVDDFGSPDLSEEFIGGMTNAGVRLHVFDPRPRVLGIRTHMFRRLHRKIVAIDGQTAFVGGINFGADQLLSSGEGAKQDYAVRVDGPLAQDIHMFAKQQVMVFEGARRRFSSWSDIYRRWWPARRWSQSDIGKAMFVVRDNADHRDDIERHYRAAIRNAKREVLIACAYFFPGYGLLHQLRNAARRGVSVKLILQGAPDMPQAKTWATMLYPSLLDAGVEIHEYCERPLHAKVAVIDDDWATVGSSNLDPLSLSLNLEANVIIRDRVFNRELRDSLEPLLQKHCQKIERHTIRRGSLWLLVSNFITYHCTRHFPRWAGWLPAHLPRLHSVEPR